MNIHTKAEIGDRIYFIYNNEVHEGIVNNMHIILENSSKPKEVYYNVSDSPLAEDEALLEDRIFLLKSDLVKYLTGGLQ